MMKHRIKNLVAIGFVLALTSTSMRAQSDDPTTSPADKKNSESSPVLDFFKSTQVSGLLDVYYGYNFNRPADQSVQLRGLETKSNSFQLSLVKLTFNRAASEKNSLGYRFDLMFGPAADSYSAFEPVSRRHNIMKHFLQAYLRYNDPLGNGLTLDFGKWATFVGAEVLESIDNWHYQHSLLFSFAQPYYHTGLRASYNASSKVSFGAYVVNGWNSSFDNNGGKSVGLSATFTANSKFQLVQNWLGGPEHPGTNEGWRHLWDTVVNISPTPHVGLKFNYDYGFETNLAPLTGRSIWQGIASSLKFSNKSQRHSFAPRFEYFKDRDGFTTGAAQAIKEITLTYDLRLKPNFSTKFEYRGDFSDSPYFKKNANELAKNQNVVMIGVVYSFGFGKD
jgi:hypothetical protein